jgi:hypothetical protein
VLAERRKTEHGELLNKLMAKGRYLRCEEQGYVAWQKCFPRSDRDRALGAFVARARRQAESAGGGLYEYATRTTALSQVCICGKRQRKPLSAARPCARLRRRRRQGPLQCFPRPLREASVSVEGIDQLDLVGARKGYGRRRQDTASKPEAERAGLVPGKPRVTRRHPPGRRSLVRVAVTRQAPRESCPGTMLRRSGAGKAKTCYRARHFVRASGRAWEPRMRHSQPCWEQLSGVCGNPGPSWGRDSVVQGWSPRPSGPGGCQEAHVGGRRCSVGLVVATSNRQGPTVLALRARTVGRRGR